MITDDCSDETCCRITVNNPLL